jgi:phosphoribosylformylglycinamidine synthase subunit PurQ / glutaminase
VIEVGSGAAIMATVDEMEQVWRGEIKQPYPAIEAKDRPAVTAKHPDWRLSTRTERVRALILHANGSNRDHDAEAALTLAGAEPEIVHVNQLVSGERKLADYHMLIVPGGFSYGDDLGAGVVWALDLKNRLGEAVEKFIADGRPVLGICNGFQALVKAGLLPGSTFTPERAVTLTYNEMGKFECRWVALQPVAGSVSLFTEGLTEPILCPVAHGEGRVMVKDDATLQQLWTGGLVALTYADEIGRPVGYPGNPNGSTDGIAALCNPAGNVLGLMPHPENHIFAWQHPRREVRMSGLRLFLNGVKYA